MTSWLRRSSLRESFRKSSTPSLQDVDPQVAFSAFLKHWQQTLEIISRSQLRGQAFQDDVTAVVNHVDQMVNLLIVDLKHILHNKIFTKDKTVVLEKYETEINTPVFDYFLEKEILSVVLQWGLNTGEFVNAVKLELLKIFELLLSHSRHEILVYKPILHPLINVLSSCEGCIPYEVEKRLVVLLNQLCVTLMHNQHLMDFFFQAPKNEGCSRFIIFSLLLPFVHREGTVGQQARDALMLCMTLSSSHVAVGKYIAEHSTFCPVLATGMSGLYSTLPRTINIEFEGWCKFSLEDIEDIPQLQVFLSSLEFCDAIIQVAHPLVKQQLVRYFYHGFLVPVLGPALSQVVTQEAIAATAYTELFLRTVAEKELKRAFVGFFLAVPETSTDDLPVLSVLITRLHSLDSYLLPCTHVMLSHRSFLFSIHANSFASEMLIHLIPIAYKAFHGFDQIAPVKNNSDQFQYFAYLKNALRCIKVSKKACSFWTWKYDGMDPSSEEALDLMNECKTTCLGLYNNTGISEREMHCSENFSAKNDLLNNGHKDEKNLDSFGDSSGYESFNLRFSELSPYHTSNSSPRLEEFSNQDKEKDEERHFLDMLSAYPTSENFLLEDFCHEVDVLCSVYLTMSRKSSESCTVDDPDWYNSSWFQDDNKLDANEEHSADDLMSRPVIGPFLEALFLRVERMLETNIYINILVTTLISKLAAYPAPLLVSFLLNPSIVFQPSLRSLTQVISTLKQKIDLLLSINDVDYIKESYNWFEANLYETNYPKAAAFSNSSNVFRYNKDDGHGSLTKTVASLFKRSLTQDRYQHGEILLENLPDRSGYRYVNRSYPTSVLARSTPDDKMHVARCALLLGEWLKELAAFSQEHMVMNS